MEVSRDPEFHKAIDRYLLKKQIYQAKLMRVEIDSAILAAILATEYFVCCKIGFTKYLN
jgi:hypothetical protein